MKTFRADPIRHTEEYIRWFNARTPQAKLIHSFETFEPEEEVLVMEHANFSMYMVAFVNVPGFIQWAAAHLREQIEFVKQGLQYLQWQFYDGDPRPWVLKQPLYFGHEPMLAEVFPGAVFVTTHRSPINTIASGTSLIENFYKAYSDVNRKQMLGATWLENHAMGQQQFLACRDTHPELHGLDIGYGEVTKNGESVIEKIYAYAGLSLSETARQAMRNWEKENSQHKKGEHKHSLEDYNLSNELVDTKCRPYIERFEHCF